MPPIEDEEPETHEITLIFQQLRDKPEQMNEALFPLIYSSMRRLAVAKMRGEKSNLTLQPTALVDDAYMRLVRSKGEWQNRRHFLGCAARAMEQILIEHARKRNAVRRGSGQASEELDENSGRISFSPENVIAVSTALRKLEAADPMKAEIVRLRHYAGATIEEIAQYMNIGETSAKKHYRLAMAMLKRDLSA